MPALMVLTSSETFHIYPNKLNQQAREPQSSRCLHLPTTGVKNPISHINVGSGNEAHLSLIPMPALTGFFPQVPILPHTNLCSHPQIIQPNNQGPYPVIPTPRPNPLHFIRASLARPHIQKSLLRDFPRPTWTRFTAAHRLRNKRKGKLKETKLSSPQAGNRSEQSASD